MSLTTESYAQSCVGCQPQQGIAVQVVPMVPQQIMVPTTIYQPYQYQGSTYIPPQPKPEFRTPIRNGFWGLFHRKRGRMIHTFAPTQSVSHGAVGPPQQQEYSSSQTPINQVLWSKPATNGVIR